MNLIFKINKKYDEKMLFEFLPEKKDLTSLNLSNLLRIDTDSIQINSGGKNVNISSIMKIQVQKKYKIITPYLKNSVIDYQKSWNSINNKFSSLVEKKTGYPWKYKKYYCVVSAYHEGISNWGGNIVARRWSINADVQRRVTAHEIVLSHFWTMLEKNEISKKWSNDKKWRYSEIFSWCLLGLDKDFFIFWPWCLQKDLFPENHQYTDILPLQKKLRDEYFKCRNFTEFFNEAIKADK